MTHAQAQFLLRAWDRAVLSTNTFFLYSTDPKAQVEYSFAVDGLRRAEYIINHNLLEDIKLESPVSVGCGH